MCRPYNMREEYIMHLNWQKKKKNDIWHNCCWKNGERDGRGDAEVYPNGPDRRSYSAFLSEDNLLFILSARSKQELENVSIAWIRDGP